jgi:hypothetical protein
MTTNAQAALQAAVTFHSRLNNAINGKSRHSVEYTADQFLVWLDENSEWPVSEPTLTIVELSPADRELLRELRPTVFNTPLNGQQEAVQENTVLYRLATALHYKHSEPGKIDADPEEIVSRAVDAIRTCEKNDSLTPTFDHDFSKPGLFGGGE